MKHPQLNIILPVSKLLNIAIEQTLTPKFNDYDINDSPYLEFFDHSCLTPLTSQKQGLIRYVSASIAGTKRKNEGDHHDHPSKRVVSLKIIEQPAIETRYRRYAFLRSQLRKLTTNDSTEIHPNHELAFGLNAFCYVNSPTFIKARDEVMAGCSSLSLDSMDYLQQEDVPMIDLNPDFNIWNEPSDYNDLFFQSKLEFLNAMDFDGYDPDQEMRDYGPDVSRENKNRSNSAAPILRSKRLQQLKRGNKLYTDAKFLQFYARRRARKSRLAKTMDSSFQGFF